MAKYDPLRTFLQSSPVSRVSMSFEQIEQLLGASLPESARVHRAWWANEAVGQHVQARSWLEAGFSVTALDQERRSVVFERV
jgi:hypothetical protein